MGHDVRRWLQSQFAQRNTSLTTEKTLGACFSPLARFTKMKRQSFEPLIFSAERASTDEVADTFFLGASRTPAFRRHLSARGIGRQFKAGRKRERPGTVCHYPRRQIGATLGSIVYRWGGTRRGPGLKRFVERKKIEGRMLGKLLNEEDGACFEQSSVQPVS